SSVPGTERASTSAVPLELNSSSASTAPTPIAATGWSCPATVKTAPAAPETAPSCCRNPARPPAGRSPGRIRADSPAAASASGHTWPVPWSMRPVRDASDGSRTGSPPRAKTIHSGTLRQVPAGLAREPRGRRPAGGTNPGPPGGGRPPARSGQHAALGQAGHADAAHADRSPSGFGRPDGAPDQVDGHADEAVRIDVGLAAATGAPRGALLHIRGGGVRRRPDHGLG